MLANVTNRRIVTDNAVGMLANVHPTPGIAVRGQEILSLTAHAAIPPHAEK